MPVTASGAESIAIVEINRARLYVPEAWIWPDKIRRNSLGTLHASDPQPKQGDPEGTVYRAGRLALVLNASEDRARFPQLRSDFQVYRLEFKPGARDLASFPRVTLDKLPAVIQRRLGPVDEDGFRQDGPPKGETFYGARDDDVTPSGFRLTFHCQTPTPAPPRFSWCYAERAAIDGLAIQYVWPGYRVNKAQWRDMDRRVLALVNWLATPPGRRPTAVEN